MRSYCCLRSSWINKEYNESNYFLNELTSLNEYKNVVNELTSLNEYKNFLHELISLNRYKNDEFLDSPMETSVWRSDKIVFFEGEAKDSQQMHIDTKTDCAPSIHRGVDPDVEVESTLVEKTEVIADPLSSFEKWFPFCEWPRSCQSMPMFIKVITKACKLWVSKVNSVEHQFSDVT